MASLSMVSIYMIHPVNVGEIITAETEVSRNIARQNYKCKIYLNGIVLGKECEVI